MARCYRMTAAMLLDWQKLPVARLRLSRYQETALVRLARDEGTREDAQSILGVLRSYIRYIHTAANARTCPPANAVALALEAQLDAVQESAPPAPARSVDRSAGQRPGSDSTQGSETAEAGSAMTHCATCQCARATSVHGTPEHPEHPKYTESLKRSETAKCPSFATGADSRGIRADSRSRHAPRCPHGAAQRLVLAPGAAVLWCGACGALALARPDGTFGEWVLPRAEPDRGGSRTTIHATDGTSVEHWMCSACSSGSHLSEAQRELVGGCQARSGRGGADLCECEVCRG